MQNASSFVIIRNFTLNKKKQLFFVLSHVIDYNDISRAKIQITGGSIFGLNVCKHIKFLARTALTWVQIICQQKI